MLVKLNTMAISIYMFGGGHLWKFSQELPSNELFYKQIS